MGGAWLRRLRQDRSGVAAVEFALLMPVMVLFTFGTAEVGRFTLLTLKLQHAANTMADLAARDEQLSLAAVQSMFTSVQHIVRPFDVADDGVVILSSAGMTNKQPATIFWQQSGAGKLGEGSELGKAGASPILPDEFVLRDGETVIVAEAIFHYRPWLLNIIPDTILRRIAYFRPRLGTLRALS